jgi:hypothetical protein
MALVTTWVTSPLLRWLYPPSRSLVDPPEHPARPEPDGVLLCVSDPAAVPALAEVARAWQKGGGGAWALHLRSTDRPQDYLRDDLEREPLAEVRRVARELGLELQGLSFPSAEPAADIVRVAALKGSPLVLLGVHRDPLGRETLGGLVGAVLDSARSDVAVLIDERRPLRTVAVDGSDPLAVRVVERLVRGGLRRADPATADLVVAGVGPPLPSEPGPSRLVVRGAA